MLSLRFEQLFRQLTAAFATYADTPRTPDRVRELAAARTELDRVRREIAEERIIEQRWIELVGLLYETDASDEASARLRLEGTHND